MDNRARKLLFDVVESARSIRQWSEGRTFTGYEQDRQLRRAVEREFEIIGEALSRLAHIDVATAGQIADLPQIVAFRNRIIHGYDALDNAIVWGIVQSHLPNVLAQASALLMEPEEEGA